jgi:hypothetical protein
MEPKKTDTYTFEIGSPNVCLAKESFKFLMAYIQSIHEPDHQLFLFAVYVRLHGSNKITNTKTNSVKIINDTIVDDFWKYLHIYREKIDVRTLSIFHSFYYVLKAIVTNDCMWLLVLVSESRKPINANIMRVHIDQKTNEITYTKPDCLKE